MNSNREKLSDTEMKLYRSVANTLELAEACDAKDHPELESVKDSLRSMIEYLWISATEEQQDILAGWNEESFVVSVMCKDYTTLPGSRFIKEGAGSAELFRTSFLIPGYQEAVKRNVSMVVNLDGCAGFSWPFLEEAFGGLSRALGLGKKDLERITITCYDDPNTSAQATEFLHAAAKNN